MKRYAVLKVKEKTFSAGCLDKILIQEVDPQCSEPEEAAIEAQRDKYEEIEWMGWFDTFTLRLTPVKGRIQDNGQ